MSREISSILDANQLLSQMVRIIQDAFGYYEVHVFLLSPAQDELTLWTGSEHGRAERGRRQRGEGGPSGPQVQSLDIDETSLNARALHTRAPVVVNDVAIDPYYLPDPGLPETRSELVVPLRLGEKMVGTLDVASTEVNAFSEEDVRVMEGLGAQIAVAIENARLYDRSRELAVLEERNRLARELHDSVTQSLYSVLLLTEGWRRMVSMGSNVYAEDTFGRIADITTQALKEMRLLINELRPPGFIAYQVAVMYLGRVVELASAQSIFDCPLHPYTQALLSAVPLPDPSLRFRRSRIVLEGEIPSPQNPPPGCHFHPRCRHAVERCRMEAPVLRPLDDATRFVACHLAGGA